MISKSKSLWSSINIPQASLADLERTLGSLSLQYKRQLLDLPLNHEKQAVLARLYSAANTLHQAVRKGMVENAIFEIGSNLIGCEQVALLVTSKRQDQVEFAGSSGFHAKQVDLLRRNAKRIMREVSTDSIFIQTSDKDRPFMSSLGISACVPFKIDDATNGAIVFFDLLPQRRGLDGRDQELLQMLCAYTGPCLAADKTKQQETSGWVQL
jgi:nitrate/nitrite-specific signal transduction histidine kinase